MIRRALVGLTVVGVLGGMAASVSVRAQSGPLALSTTSDTRAIRRDLPMTNAIRAAFAAGTRDASGRPGPNYWQLEADYTIKVSLDPARHTLTGTETIVMHNNSPDALNQIRLRLDNNIFRGLVPRGTSVPAENTEGMVVTKIVANGTAIDLNAAPAAGGRGRGGRGGNANAPRTMSVSGLDQTLATINLATPVARSPTRRLKSRGTRHSLAAHTVAATA